MISFMMQCMKGQKSSNRLIISIITFFTMIEFIVFGCYEVIRTNPITNIVDATSGASLEMLCFFIIVLEFFCTLFLNNFIMELKSEEYGIVILSGKTTAQLITYSFVQTCFYYGISFMLGVVSCLLLAVGISNMTFFSIPITSTFLLFLFYSLAKFSYVLVIAIGKMIRTQDQVGGYLSKQQGNIASKANYFSKVNQEPVPFPYQTTIKLVGLIGLLIYCIYNIIKPNILPSMMISYFVYLLIFLALFIVSIIPFLFNLLHDRVLLKYPTFLLLLASLVKTITKTKVFIMMNSISLPFLLLILMNASKSSFYPLFILCYCCVLSLLCASFLLQFSVYLPSKNQDLALLQAINYSKKQLKQIHFGEYLIYTICFFILPFLLYSFILLRMASMDMLMSTSLTSFIVIYGVFYGLLSLLLYFMYSIQLKEACGNVKYLARKQ